MNKADRALAELDSVVAYGMEELHPRSTVPVLSQFSRSGHTAERTREYVDACRQWLLACMPKIAITSAIKLLDKEKLTMISYEVAGMSDQRVAADLQSVCKDMQMEAKMLQWHPRDEKEAKLLEICTESFHIARCMPQKLRDPRVREEIGHVVTAERVGDARMRIRELSQAALSALSPQQQKEKLVPLLPTPKFLEKYREASVPFRQMIKAIRRLPLFVLVRFMQERGSGKVAQASANALAWYEELHGQLPSRGETEVLCALAGEYSQAFTMKTFSERNAFWEE